MRELLKKRMKEQKGFTLIELLAVIVILAIILAIAIPAVSKLIDNSRIDAQIANAQQIEGAAKLYFADNPSLEEVTVTYGQLKSAGLLEPIKDPHGDDEYDETNTYVTKAADGTIKTRLAGEGNVLYFEGKSASDYTRVDFEPNK